MAHYRLQHLSIHKFDPQQSALGEVVEANTFREAVRKVYFMEGVDVPEAELNDMVSGWVEHDDKFVMDYNEEIIDYFFKLPL